MMRSSTSPLAVSMMMGTSELSRMARHTRSPGTRGSMRSSTTRSKWCLLNSSSASGHAHGGDPIVLTFQISRYRIADGLLILNQENTSGFVAHRCRLLYLLHDSLLMQPLIAALHGLCPSLLARALRLRTACGRESVARNATSIIARFRLMNTDLSLL